MSNLMKQYRGAGGLALLLGTTSVLSVGACGEAFSSSCLETRTCKPSNPEGGAGGVPDEVGGQAALGGQGGGDVILGGAGAGQLFGGAPPGGAAGEGGAPVIGAAGEGGVPAMCGDGIVQGSEECDDKNPISGDGCSKTCTVDAPPAGAFAWYKATKDDVEIRTATLSDSNDFVKSFWAKTELTAKALQPDAEGGNTATAIHALNSKLSLGGSMKHALATTSSNAIRTMRIRAKMGARRYVTIGASPGPNLAAFGAMFDLQDGVVTQKYGVQDAKITLLSNQWYACETTLIAEPEIVIGVPADGAPSSEALVWLQDAEVEQAYVTKWNDRVGTRHLEDPTGAWRWHEALSVFNGSPALESNYKYSAQLVAAGSAADWQFLHDGSGGTTVTLQKDLAPSKGSFSSAGTEYSGSEQGVSLGASKTDPTLWRYAVSNAGGEQLFAILGGSTTGAKWLAASYATAQSPDAQLFEDGVMIGSAKCECDAIAAINGQAVQVG
jgi:cysteine-rich repeat protein